MPSLPEALHARLSSALASMLGTRIYPGYAPQDAAKPYVRYQIVSDPRPEHLAGYDRVRITRVQIDCFSSKYLEARAVAENIIASLETPATVSGVRFGHTKAEGPRDLGEDTTSGWIHRMSLDLLIEHSLA